MLWLYLGRATAQGTGFFLSHSTDGTWQIRDALRLLKTKENWMACRCFRGLVVQQTEAKTAWQPLPQRRKSGTCIQCSSLLLKYPKDWSLSSLTWSANGTQNTLQAWGHKEQKRSGWLVMLDPENQQYCIQIPKRTMDYELLKKDTHKSL